MKASEYIVSFLAQKGVRDIFGYPGGMVTYLMDALANQATVRAHICYHEQAAAMEACGYAQVTGLPGVAFATSGPGATNFVTGIANAYFDSIPALFITGQVNTYESAGDLKVRQKGFQETDIVAIVDSITKYSAYVDSAQNLRYQLERAWHEAISGRPGPVLLDIPMDVQRADLDFDLMPGYRPPQTPQSNIAAMADDILSDLAAANRPCILVGAGVQASFSGDAFSRFAAACDLPVVSSLLAVDVLPGNPRYYGFVGAYGQRAANFVLSKSDCILSLGSRLDIRQTGADTAGFAPGAKLLRVDIDPDEMDNRVKLDELQHVADLRQLLPVLADEAGRRQWRDYGSWLAVCDELRDTLHGIDDLPVNDLIHQLSLMIPSNTVVTTDVGQNQIWVAQSFACRGQRILFSGGHGAMGYSLPAAIGAYIGAGGQRPVVSFSGDGGLQMNIQELQFIARDRLPVKIVVLNNHALGMIRHFQEMYFDARYSFTREAGGYTTPDFCAVAQAYGIPAVHVDDAAAVPDGFFTADGPALLEVGIAGDTYVYPKLAMGKPNQDQEPPLDRRMYDQLNNL